MALKEQDVKGGPGRGWGEGPRAAGRAPPFLHLHHLLITSGAHLATRRGPQVTRPRQSLAELPLSSPCPRCTLTPAQPWGSVLLGARRRGRVPGLYSGVPDPLQVSLLTLAS